MANLLEQAGAGLSAFSWDSMGYILIAIIGVLAMILFFGAIFLIMWWRSFNIKVSIYEPFGQVPLSTEEMKSIYTESRKGNYETLKKKNLKFDTFKRKTTRGKHISQKGTHFFQTFMPLRKHEPVPMEMMFNDGIHLLRLSKHIFISVPKPDTTINVGGSVSISVADNNKWILWNNMMAERINMKYRDVDAQKKALMYFVIGIAAMVIIGGFILWLIYASVNKGYDAADKIGQLASKLGGGNVPA